MFIQQACGSSNLDRAIGATPGQQKQPTEAWSTTKVNTKLKRRQLQRD